MKRKLFDAKLHPQNIVDAKLKVMLSDGSLIEIDADIMSMVWTSDDE